MSETSQGLDAWLVFLKCTVLKTQVQLTAKFCFIDSHFGENFLIFRKFINILILSNLYYYSFVFTVFLNPVSSLVSLDRSITVLPNWFFWPLWSPHWHTLHRLLYNSSLSQVPKPLHYWIEFISFSVYFWN